MTSTQCAPRFGLNSTNTCVSVCLSGQFQNYVMYRCDLCPRTCLTCLTESHCYTCNSNSLLHNNVCFEYCNVTNSSNIIRFYNSNNRTCTASCPVGTYASVIFCKLCNDVCSSCFGTASNCTNCSNGLYLHQNTCLNACPSSFKPTIARACEYCNITCSTLTYNTNISNINGQMAVFMTFSNDISINGNLYNTFKLVTTSRRLLQTSTAPTGYQIIIIDIDGFKNYHSI